MRACGIKRLRPILYGPPCTPHVCVLSLILWLYFVVTSKQDKILNIKIDSNSENDDFKSKVPAPLQRFVLHWQIFLTVSHFPLKKKIYHFNKENS